MSYFLFPARVLSLVFVVAAALSVLIATLTPVSRFKGRIRLLGSCLVGVAFLVTSVTEMIRAEKLWPQSLLTAAGIFLIWIGFRKYQRDPKGRTRTASIL